MAKKVNAMKLAEAARGQAEVTDRQPTRESAALCLMQVRLPMLKIFRSKRKLPVLMDDETRAQIEHPVKIRHAG
jgi:hypothetical protein